MATKGFNPFLMEADPAAGADPASNPFLSDFAPAPAPAQEKPFSGASDNPFLNPFGAPPAAAAAAPPTGASAFVFNDPPPVPANGGGNPFAFFAEPTAAAAPSSNGPFASAAPDTSNMWGAPAAAPASEPPTASFFDTGSSAEDDITGPAVPPPASVPATTKELLDSVTGVLEATSVTLMDRINQPSPVNLMPSPSPSPRSPSPDLLLGDEPPPPAPPSSANPMARSPHRVDDIMDLFNAPQQTGPKTTMDILGLYNTAATSSAPPAPTPARVTDAPISSLISLVEEPTVVPPTPAPGIAPADPEVDLLASQPPTQEPFKSPSPVATPKEMLSPVQPPVETEIPTPEAVSSPVRAAPPERPKPPPPQVVRSPVHEVKPLPSRPPPPVPPSPRHVPQPSAPVHPPPPSVPAPPVQAVTPTHSQPQTPVAPPAVPSQPPSPAVPPQPVLAAPPPVPPQPRASPAKPPPPSVPPAPAVMADTSAFAPPASVPLAFAPPASVPSAFAPPTSVPSAFAPPTSVPSAFSPPTSVPSAFAPPASVPSAFAPPASIPAAFAPAPEPPNVVDRPFMSADTTSSSAAAAFTTPAPTVEIRTHSAFDDFDAKFNSISEPAETGGSSAFGDAFGGSPAGGGGGGSAWGGSSGFGDENNTNSAGFGGGGFDSFLSLTEPPPVPQSTPAKTKRGGDVDDDEADQDLSITIRPRNENETFGLAPALAPPPKSPAISTNSGYSEDSGNNFVPFLSSARDTTYDAAAKTTQMNRTDSQETPQTPLFEEDTSQPLEDFPRTKFEGVEGWEMHMRHPNKKKITGQRFWKKVYVRIVVQNDIPIIHICNQKGDKDPFQEIPLQPCYSCSDISAQQFDQFGKIFTIKIQYVFYKERPGVRPGQVSKAGRIADKLSQFTAYAIQGDYQGVKEFGSDLKKLGLPLEHAPQISQLVKLGTQNYEEMKQFSSAVEEALFRLPVHRDRAIQYKTEEIQVTLVDEYYVEQDIYGVVTRQIARVRLFFLSFLSGVADVEMGMNDLRRQGKEVVGRHDIIPIATEEWIRTEAIEFSNCVQPEEYEISQTIKFKPPDASYIELLRFRVRPPRHRELPLQVKTVFTQTGQRIEIRSDILVPGFTSRKLGQIPCEDVMIRFPIPECWIYMFRVEKHFRYGSVKSAHRRSGKVKGIERLLGAVEAVENSLMEVTSGQAKYEHQHKAIVWRIPRLPKEGQGAYTTHSFFCHIQLQAHETIPDNLSKHCYVEFTMPHTTISHTVCRSIAVPSCEEPPEKCVRYLSRHEYMVEIEHTQGFTQATYNLAAATKKEEPPKEENGENVDRTQGWFPEEKPKADDDSDFSDD